MIWINPIQEASAIGITFKDNTTTDPRGIVRIGNKILVTDPTTDNTKVWDATTFALLGTITGVTDPGPIASNSAGTRAYVMGSLSFGEIDIDNYAVLRTVSHGCTPSEGAFFDVNNDNFYCVTSTETIVKIPMGTMTASTISTTMNAGATPCVVSVDIFYEQATDTLFATCTGPSRIVSIELLTVSGTPDFAIVQGVAPEELAFNTRVNNLLQCSSGAGAPTLYNYTFAGGFTLWKTISSSTTAEQCTAGLYGGLQYDFTSDRYFFHTSNEKVFVVDGTTGDTLYSQTITAGGGVESQFFVYSNTVAYGVLDGTTTTTDDYYVFDLTGIPTGEGAGSVLGASVCYVDRNFDGTIDIVFRDIGGPDGIPDSAGDGGVPDGICDWGRNVNPVFPNGGLNQTTNDVGCMIGILECDENGNPVNDDIATNGMGYLLTVVLLALMISFFAMATLKTGLDIPEWVWIIGTMAILLVSSQLGYTDNTLVLIGIIVIAGMVAVKIGTKLSLGGGFR